MYIPDDFKIEDSEAIEQIVSEYGFATLITPSPDGLSNDLKVSHIPLLYDRSDDGGTITGHMARANDHWQAFDGETESLAIFQGPDAYISPEWYEEGPAAPTWNFAVVHMRGPVHAIEGREWLSDHVDELVEHHETKTLGHSTATDSEFKAIRLGSIVGIRMKITTIEAKFKLNQNRSAADRSKVAQHLDASGNEVAGRIAALMRRHGEA